MVTEEIYLLQIERDEVKLNRMEEKQSKKQRGKQSGGSCDSCSFYVFDEDYDDYMCQVSMDEDDVVRLMCDKHFDCPYYQLDDEYRVVRRQM